MCGLCEYGMDSKLGSSLSHVVIPEVAQDSSMHIVAASLRVVKYVTLSTSTY